MKTTKDRTWEVHCKNGIQIEESTAHGYKFLLLQVKEQHSFMHYHYRLLVFPNGYSKPIVSLNLETNPEARTTCLGLHHPDGHQNCGFSDSEMSLADFKYWAYKTAWDVLDLPAEKWKVFVEGGSVASLDPMSRIWELAEQSFVIAHDYVELLKKFNKAASSFMVIFKGIDHSYFLKRLTHIQDDIYASINMIQLIAANNEVGTVSFKVMAYLIAIKDASKVTVDRIEFLMERSKGKARKHPELNELISREHRALEKCQRIGEELSALYRNRKQGSL